MQNSQKVEAVFHEVLNWFLRSTYISLSRAKIVDGRLQTTKIGFLLWRRTNIFTLFCSIKWKRVWNGYHLGCMAENTTGHRLPNQHVRDSQIYFYTRNLTESQNQDFWSNWCKWNSQWQLTNKICSSRSYWQSVVTRKTITKLVKFAKVSSFLCILPTWIIKTSSNWCIHVFSPYIKLLSFI